MSGAEQQLREGVKKQLARLEEELQDLLDNK